jgi:hypothetical protein
VVVQVDLELELVSLYLPQAAMVQVITLLQLALQLLQIQLETTQRFQPLHQMVAGAEELLLLRITEGAGVPAEVETPMEEVVPVEPEILRLNLQPEGMALQQSLIKDLVVVMQP